MTLEQQVCSLELAKRLKELGVKQESAFYWQEYKPTHDYHLWFSEVLAIQGAQGEQPMKGDCISAFTVAELGNILPPFLKNPEGQTMDLCATNKGTMGWWVSYEVEGKQFYSEFAAPTESDARATMLVYLIENNLITLP